MRAFTGIDINNVMNNRCGLNILLALGKESEMILEGGRKGPAAADLYDFCLIPEQDYSGQAWVKSPLVAVTQKLNEVS
ncbi:hypothetical protein GCM10011352_17490 [Marinobacterium zhoushanense]|uniref:Uncharacterized protein n=1 Tax=Marinobacterium zhoushanense TaxID=1679163 RepID=A0ABQ1KAH5_9GAMM|nr:hypothetical protein GCM10011352_17490 [Marinobacterium zhoushanense]